MGKGGGMVMTIVAIVGLFIVSYFGSALSLSESIVDCPRRFLEHESCDYGRFASRVRHRA